MGKVGDAESLRQEVSAEAAMVAEERQWTCSVRVLQGQGCLPYCPAGLSSPWELQELPLPASALEGDLTGSSGGSAERREKGGPG